MKDLKTYVDLFVSVLIESAKIIGFVLDFILKALILVTAAALPLFLLIVILVGIPAGIATGIDIYKDKRSKREEEL